MAAGDLLGGPGWVVEVRGRAQRVDEDDRCSCCRPSGRPHRRYTSRRPWRHRAFHAGAVGVCRCGRDGGHGEHGQRAKAALAARRRVDRVTKDLHRHWWKGPWEGRPAVKSEAQRPFRPESPPAGRSAPGRAGPPGLRLTRGRSARRHRRADGPLDERAGARCAIPLSSARSWRAASGSQGTAGGSPDPPAPTAGPVGEEQGVGLGVDRDAEPRELRVPVGRVRWQLVMSQRPRGQPPARQPVRPAVRRCSRSRGSGWPRRRSPPRRGAGCSRPQRDCLGDADAPVVPAGSGGEAGLRRHTRQYAAWAVLAGAGGTVAGQVAHGSAGGGGGAICQTCH